MVNGHESHMCAMVREDYLTTELEDLNPVNCAFFS